MLCLLGQRRIARARRVGIFAGSFNPLTLAHVALAEAARRQARLDTIVWAAAVVTVDKERVERAALADRLTQVRAYLRGTHRDALAVFNRGLYVDQARALRPLLVPDAELVMLVGYDKIVQIFDARYYDDRDAALDALFAEAQIAVAPRSHAGTTELETLLALPANRRFAHYVTPLELPDQYAEESSTEARRRAASGTPPRDELRGLLPPEGAALVRETDAYRLAPSSALLNDVDTYTLRQRWLHALMTLPASVVRRVAPLSTLVAQSRAATSEGGAIRRWLAAAATDAGDPRAQIARQREHAAQLEALGILGIFAATAQNAQDTPAR